MERGHVYIAQPPLYKVRKGKQEQYLKDDAELAAYQTQAALEGASLHVNKDAPAIAGDSLEAIVKEYNDAHSIISRLGRFYPAELLEMMIFVSAVTEQQLSDRTQVESWIEEMSSHARDAHARNK